MLADLLDELTKKRDKLSQQGKADAALRLGATVAHYRKLLQMVEPSGSPALCEQLQRELKAQLADACDELGEAAPSPTAAVSIPEPATPKADEDVAALADELRAALASWRSEDEAETERLRAAVCEQAAAIERIMADQRRVLEAIDRLASQVSKATTPEPRRGFWSRLFHRHVENPF